MQALPYTYPQFPYGNYAHGVIAGFAVVSVVRETLGPDMRDSDLTVFSQTVDFRVTWYEPSP